MSIELPSITIGIPFFNAEATLLDAVRCVFAQTHQDWELILMDDGSTDRSLELAHSIQDSRVKVYSDGLNRRLATRLNEIAGLASHAYLARMDADDLMSPFRIERQLSKLVSHPELDIVSTGVYSLTDADVPVGARYVSTNHFISPLSLLAGNSGIVHASVIGRTSWFERNNYRVGLRSSEDANLWVRAFANNDLNVGFLSEPLYYYREDGNVVLSKLTTAYREGLNTILNDSGSSFSLIEKAHGFSLILAKLVVARLLFLVGSRDFLRKRRNGSLLSATEKLKLMAEISSIKNIKLPAADF